MLYRILRANNSGYALCVLGLYIGAFLLGFALLFVFPQITLLMLFLGLGGLAFFSLGSIILRAAQRWLAHRTLSAGACPSCQQPIELLHAPEDHWRCMSCGAVYSANGEETPSPAAAAANPDDRVNF